MVQMVEILQKEVIEANLPWGIFVGCKLSGKNTLPETNSKFAT